MPDEFIDILDNTGKPTGEVKLKSEAHQLGLYHATVHIWLYTPDGKLLFQKRAKNKDTFPNLWDVSVAGHIGSGESPLDSAIREIKEEIGITVSEKKLHYVGRYLEEKKPSDAIRDNEFHFIFLLPFSSKIEDLQLQEEEVSEVALVSITDFRNLLLDPYKRTTFVPHDPAYYNFILKEVSLQLS